MNTKRMMRWVIVLFLLAALPVMTAVMAQEPAGKPPLPTITEPGESAAPETYNVYESEPNSTRATADLIWPGDVMGGKANYDGDYDFFKIPVDPHNTVLLIDVEAESIGSEMDSLLCVEDSLGNPIACSDDAGSADSLIFIAYGQKEFPEDVLFLRLAAYGFPSGDDIFYELIVSYPLLISAAAGNLGTGIVGGIPFRSEDILAWSELNTGDEKWVLLFDGSDVNITKNVANIAAAGDGSGSLLIGLAANQTVAPIGTVTPWDIIKFTPGQLGPETVGGFSWFFQGKSNLLTTSGEKIDAFDDWASYGTGNFPGIDVCEGFLISTTGAAAVRTTGNVLSKHANEDIFCKPAGSGAGIYKAYFDGSLLTRFAPEDVVATAYRYEEFLTYQLLTLEGTATGVTTVPGPIVTQKDILQVEFPHGSDDWVELMWHGPDHGWNYNIDALEWSP